MARNMFRAVVHQERLPEVDLRRTVIAGALLHDQALNIPRIRASALTDSTFPLIVDIPHGDFVRAALEAGQFSHVRNVDLRLMTIGGWFQVLGGRYGSRELDLLPVHEDLILTTSR